MHLVDVVPTKVLSRESREFEETREEICGKVRMLECPGLQWESKQSILEEALTDSSIVAFICFVNCTRISELFSGFELEEQQQQQQQMVCPMAHSMFLSASTVVGNQPAIPSCLCRLLLLPLPSRPAIAVSSVNRFQTTKPTSWCLRESEGRGSFCRPPARCQFGSGDDEPETEGITLQEREGAIGGRDRLASAVGLIMGTAVGPGILGLPAATLQAGLLPSSAAIVAAWAYVMASILLVAELSYAVMLEQGEEEVSFTGLAVYTLGRRSGLVVSAVYALLIYALLVACIAGLGSVVACWLPPLPQGLVCCLSPGIVMAMLAFAPFKAMDSLNRALCSLMIVAITSLVGIGISAKREKLMMMMMMMPGSGSSSTSYGTSLTLQAVLSAIPLIALTLAFHVITPLVCKVVGGTPEEARNAILCGGVIPLAMVLVWNAVILALAPPPQLLSSSKILDPIKLLLSTSSLAAPAVQAFAFSALGTTLIGYALSFPKQLMDTADLFMSSVKSVSGTTNQNVFSLEECWWQDKRRMAALAMALGPSVAVAIICPTAFATALNFAGVYANCFLFGVLPPVLAWEYRRRSHHQNKQVKSTRLVPGGDLMLLFLLLIAISLGFRPSGSTT
ncbi:unnamed protein product [Sphagnum compactum]